ncbi:MAG TPA: tetratricopeptide repeat protein [Aeromonadales bacterium]|nr:tetratricopeptide repeat protein [Aeromonadales bacterium]
MTEKEAASQNTPSIPDFRLGSWLVCPKNQTISTQTLHIELEPKMMKMLCVLAEADGNVVARTDLFEKVWGNQVVGENALNTCISALRNHLKKVDGKNYIKAKPKLGYQLTQPINWKIESDNDSTITAKKITNHQKWPVLLSAVVIVIVIGWFFKNYFATKKVNEDNNNPAKPYSIAVLPIENFSHTSEYDFMAKGLTEQIIHQLATLSQFRVISRTSSSSFSNQQLSAKEIAKKLKVDYLIEGSLQQDQEFVVTIQLIDTRTDTHIWSKIFRSPRDRLFEFQQKIGDAITSSFETDSKDNQKRIIIHHPREKGAYENYLKGQAYASLNTKDSLNKALVSYSKALDIAPDYALANAGYALVSLLLYQNGQLKPEVALPQASKAIDLALSTEPNLAEAYAAKGLLKTYERSYEAAEKNFQQALSINPRLTKALHNYGFLLWSQFRFQKALTYFEKALEHNPLSPMTNFAISDTLFNLGNIESSIQHFNYCLEILPENSACMLGLARVYRSLNNLKKEDALLEKVQKLLKPDDIYLSFATILNLEAKGLWKEANQVLIRIDPYYSDVYTYRLQQLMFNWMHKNKHTKKLIKQQNWKKSERHLLLAGADAFWNGHCKLAIEFYQPVYESSPRKLRLIDDLLVGVSHELNLAYCYEETGDIIRKKHALKSALVNIQKFINKKYPMPGIYFALSRYYQLKGNYRRAKQIYQDNNLADWSWSILLKTDPVFNSITIK